MPIQNGRDSQGGWYRWGNRGHKYHYTPGNVSSRNRAYESAMRQARAILASQYYHSTKARKRR